MGRENERKARENHQIIKQVKQESPNLLARSSLSTLMA